MSRVDGGEKATFSARTATRFTLVVSFPDVREAPPLPAPAGAARAAALQGGEQHRSNRRERAARNARGQHRAVAARRRGRGGRPRLVAVTTAEASCYVAATVEACSPGLVAVTTSSRAPSSRHRWSSRCRRTCRPIVVMCQSGPTTVERGASSRRRQAGWCGRF